MRAFLRSPRLGLPSLLVGLFALAGAACGADSGSGSNSAGTGSGTGGSGDGGSSGSGDGGDSSGSLVTSGAGGGGGQDFLGDPKTCDEAAAARTYIGCDFWPTVTANMVWSIFDYAVVVANAADEPATVTVDRGGAPMATVTVQPNSLEKIYLPWVPELKGPEAECDGTVTQTATTSRVPGGAYHLVSSIPVTVYQFNALEYAPQGGPPGKDWSACPGNSCGTPCFSYSNDASLLLPSTALTTNYRITGYPSWTQAQLGSYVAITGTEDATNVTVSLGPLGGTQPGGGIPQGTAGQALQFPLARGEVVQLFGSTTGDLSGGLVQADKPIQVIHGIPCIYIPDGNPACDHLEESVLPAETLGKRYFVTAPSGASGAPVGQVVRLVGNVNGTTLTYPGATPPNAPTTINAGQVVSLGVVATDFEVVGSNEFAVSTFLLGASVSDPGGQRGDPAQSAVTAVEQYRTKYVFLAPSDYDANFVDVVMPLDAQVSLDGAALSVSPVPISSDFGVARVPLSLGNNGAHLIEATAPVGIQVVGYGSFTSYQYPGGLDLRAIAPPPPPPN